MQIGDPPQPVQASLITARIFGLRFRFTVRFAFSATAIWLPQKQAINQTVP